MNDGRASERRFQDLCPLARRSAFRPRAAGFGRICGILLLAACSEDPVGPELGGEGSLARCEGRARTFYEPSSGDPSREEWVVYDDRARPVNSEVEVDGVLTVVHRSAYDADDNLVEELRWNAGDALVFAATTLEGGHVVEYTITHGSGPIDAIETREIDTLALVWSDGVHVGSLLDEKSDGVPDVRYTHSREEGPDRRVSETALDRGLDGTIDSLYGETTSTDGVLVEEWSDSPVGGELEEQYLAELDADGRAVSSARYALERLYEACTYTWEGRVMREQTCELGGVEPNAREHVVRIDDADGRIAEQLTYHLDLTNSVDEPEVLSERVEWTWDCPSDAAGG